MSEEKITSIAKNILVGSPYTIPSRLTTMVSNW